MNPTSGSPRTSTDAVDADHAREETPAHKAARLWVHQFARTLKTSRLYEQNANATVERFFDDLAVALDGFHDTYGSLELRFSSDDVQYDGVSLYLARSRDDNLALPFYRDGIRSITLEAGITKDQIEALVAALIRVTALQESDDDLVTLLWESHLDHIAMDYVPAEGEVGVGVEAEEEEEPPMPWPEPEDPAQVVTVEEEEGTAQPMAPRSDDWIVRELTIEVEAGFAELESLAPSEMRRFHSEYEAEHQVPLTTTAIAVIEAYLAAGGAALDTRDLGNFLPRVLRESLDQGRWLEVAATLEMLDRYRAGEWSRETFSQELLQPISIASLVHLLDVQDAETVLDFVEMTTAVGAIDVDLLVSVMAQSESRRNRRILTEAAIERCSTSPERLAPWLADPRPPVVATVVQMLGTVGGSAVVGLLEGLLRHGELRVRHAVVAALGQLPAEVRRPGLLAALEGADPRTFCYALQALASGRDADLAQRLIALTATPDFEKRPALERRAIFHALGSVADDTQVSDLETELNRVALFSPAPDEHRSSVARCLMAMGTPRALETVRRGARSRRAAVREVCELVLADPDGGHANPGAAA